MDSDHIKAQAVMHGLAGKRHPEEWSPAEALLAFMGWMTVRHHDDDINDNALMLHRVRQFCERHDLRIIREDWQELIIAEPDTLSPVEAYELWMKEKLARELRRQPSFTD